jgi:hypothetical protein
MYEREGFVECDGDRIEDGFEKIAIYSEDGEYNHAARQPPGGRWASKLGREEDIEHDSLEALVGPEFATVTHYMKRARALPSSTSNI